MQKQTYFNKKIQSNLKWKKNYHHPTFIQYKKSLINVFHLYRMKKKLKEAKNKIKNIWWPS
jgi:hypothetical protein